MIFIYFLVIFNNLSPIEFFYHKFICFARKNWSWVTLLVSNILRIFCQVLKIRIVIITWIFSKLIRLKFTRSLLLIWRSCCYWLVLKFWTLLSIQIFRFNIFPQFLNLWKQCRKLQISHLDVPLFLNLICNLKLFDKLWVCMKYLSKFF